jgi:hypothetical protein
MKKTIIPFIFFITLNSCVQNYSDEYKAEAEQVCKCMKYKQSNRKGISPDIAFIYDDEDYKICILDAIINEVKTKGDEFTNAIKDICPNQLETHERYIKGL